MTDESRSLVIPHQLRTARECLELPLAEVADALSIKSEELTNWEKGLSEPPVERLWDLAEFYNRSTDYFLRQAPSLPDQLNFRLARRKAMGDLPLEARRVLVRFDELCRAESELERALGKPRRILVERLTRDWTPEELASRERERLELGGHPIKDLRKLLTDQGIKIFMLPVPENGLSGLSWWHEEYGPCILVNARDYARRRSFTLAHEYAHLLRSDVPTVCDGTQDIAEERFATKFAAIFLMPASHLEREFRRVVGPPGTLPTDQQLGTLAWRYRVSLEALGRRLEELELLPKGTTDLRIAEWEARPPRYRGAKGPRWRRQLGEEFVSLAVEAHSEGHISLGKLAQYLGQDIRKVLEVAEQARAPDVSRKDA